MEIVDNGLLFSSYHAVEKSSIQMLMRDRKYVTDTLVFVGYHSLVVY